MPTEEDQAHELRDAKPTISWLRRYAKGRVLLDCGANVGHVSAAALELFDKVVAVEAHPATFKRLALRFRDEPRVVCRYRAVMAKSGTEVLISSPPHSTSSRITVKPRPSEGASYYKAVPTVSMRRLLTKYRPDVVKMDIEGSEYEALRSVRLHWFGVKRLLVEFHNTRKRSGYANFVATDRHLHRCGYRRVRPERLSMLPDGSALRAVFFLALYERDRLMVRVRRRGRHAP